MKKPSQEQIRRDKLLEIIYNKPRSISGIFDFDMLSAPPLTSFLSEYDMMVLNDIINDPVIEGNDEMKRKFIHEIVEYRGFRRLSGGTNRIIFRHEETQDIVIKVAIDKVGATDAPREIINQHFVKPFVPKTFEHSKYGNVGLFERVEPITNIYQFMDIADDVYNLITEVFIKSGYALNDFGCDYFKNYGIRKGWGPVLLDYPYLYVVDPNKLYCKSVGPNGKVCDAQIDYDEGFNKIICTKCGRVYSASEIGVSPERFNNICDKLIRRKEISKMKIAVYEGDKLLTTTNTIKTVNNLNEVKNRKNSGKNQNVVSSTGKMKITVEGNYSREELAQRRQDEVHRLAEACKADKERGKKMKSEKSVKSKVEVSDEEQAKVDKIMEEAVKKEERQPKKWSPKESAPFKKEVADEEVAQQPTHTKSPLEVKRERDAELSETIDIEKYINTQSDTTEESSSNDEEQSAIDNEWNEDKEQKRTTKKKSRKRNVTSENMEDY